MTRKDARENAAANAVLAGLAKALGASLTASKWDDGSSDGMHDFYIEGGGHRIALEVTTIADGARVGRDHRWERAAPDGCIVVDGVTGIWLAHHEGETEAADVIPVLQVEVPRLERLGVSSVETRRWQLHAFTAPELRPPDFDSLRALDTVGVTYVGRAMESPEPRLAATGEVHISRGFEYVRPSDRNYPITFIEGQLRGAHDSDVQKLVAVEDATARHLWMWVELAEGLSLIRSFDAEGLPDASLDVEGIDGVWVGRSPTSDIVEGYSWVRDRGWDKFAVPRDEVVA